MGIIKDSSDCTLLGIFSHKDSEGKSVYSDVQYDAHIDFNELKGKVSAHFKNVYREI